MTVLTRNMSIATDGNADMIDITDQVASIVRETALQDGIVTLFCPSSTSGLTTIEYEPGALSDLRRVFDQIAPANQVYQHNQRWHDNNGHSHIRAALLGASLTVPFTNRSLTLGTWQQIILVDFDNRPRNRQLILQVIGD